MEILNWLENGMSAPLSLVTLPSVGHIFALLTIFGLWRYRVDAFDPNPRSSTAKNTNPMLTPPPPSGPPPSKQQGQIPRHPSAHTLTEWETDSQRSCESQSADVSVGSQDAPISTSPEPLEPSYFMQAECPDSTKAERQRFLVARNGDEEKALKNLVKYTQWRQKFQSLRQQQEQNHHNIQVEDYDLYDWMVASQVALHANNEAKDGRQRLPRIVRTHALPNGQIAVDRDESRIIHMIPAQIDDRICSLATYSLAIAIYLDRKLDRESLEKMTIIMDLRPGEGWRNISAVRLLPFIKSIVGLLLTMFPERLHRSVLYPLPFALTWVFGAVKAVIDPETASKLVVLSGSAGKKSPLPLDKLSQYVSKDVALMCENERLASFSC